ncbi:MAG TPA: c-type cytochrome [Pseudorhodoplanes sp.]|jgi:mono/diheme cytochrome c family protein|nr:c-type cytochrome [Pseudorhodoplanes sp.]
MKATGLILLAWLAGVGLAAAADARNGEILAHRWCASCHIVGPAQNGGNADVPTFASIAARPGFNPQTIANFLRDPHPKMPNMALSRGETDDLAAYIASLRK